MLSERELSAAIGSTAYDGSGDKIGTVEHFFVDDRTGAPTWVAVTTGLFGTRHSVVPAVDASFADGNLRLPVSVDAVKSAPHVGGDHLDPSEEAELRRHYGLDNTGPDNTGLEDDDPGRVGLGTGTGALAEARTQEMRAVVPPVPAAASAGTDDSRTDDSRTDDALADDTRTDGAMTAGAMTRSEEQLRVGTERVATTRARIVKYIVTEEVQITVPIRREEIRIEQVPLDAADDGPGESLLSAEDRPVGRTEGGTVGGLPDEIILHTERPVVSVEVVPTERVRLRTEVVHGQETITGQVQREEIVVDETWSPGVTPR